MNNVKSVSPSKWRCNYHIVFAPKYRRQVIYGTIKADIGKILLVSILPHLSISQFMR